MPRSPAPCTAPIFFRDARFSVLTPHAIRIERHPGCCGGGARCEFDSLPSTAFTERRPPAAGRRCVWANASALEINTSALALRYSGGAVVGPGSSLSVTSLETGHVWTPGSGDGGNLNGTLVSTDCGGMVPLTPEVCIAKYQSMLQPGLLSRGFGVLIDDTHSFLLDGDPAWPPYGWRKHRAARMGYTDHTFFGHGRDYRRAMADFVTLSGEVALMPSRAYNFIYSTCGPFSAFRKRSATK